MYLIKIIALSMKIETSILKKIKYKRSWSHRNIYVKVQNVDTITARNKSYFEAFSNCAHDCKLITVYGMLNIKINSLCHLFDMTDACNSPSSVWCIRIKTAKKFGLQTKRHKVVFLYAALAVCSNPMTYKCAFRMSFGVYR